MLDLLTDVPDGVDALCARGTVTAHDYERSFAPLVDQARRTGRRMRLLYQFGPEFDRLTPGALWADTRLGRGYLRLLDGCAVVSDIDWIAEPTRAIGGQMPCPVRVFGNDERPAALAWLSSLPELPPVSGRAMASAYLGGTAAGLARVGLVVVRRIGGHRGLG